MAPKPPPALARIRQVSDAGNLVRFLAALILAFALWSWVTYQRDPEISKDVPSIPVAVVNLKPGLQVTSQLPSIEVWIEGPESILRNFGSGNVVAQVDLRDLLKPGVYTVPVKIHLPVDQLRAKQIIPKEVQVTLK
jgi:hypothetical protein